MQNVNGEREKFDCVGDYLHLLSMCGVAPPVNLFSEQMIKSFFF